VKHTVTALMSFSDSRYLMRSFLSFSESTRSPQIQP